MDYLACEISMENMALDKISEQLTLINTKKDAHSKRVRMPDKLEIQSNAVSYWVKEIDEIPKNTFEFECLQNVRLIHRDIDVKWNRYLLKTPLSQPMLYYLSLAYCIIKKDLKIDGLCPTEIVITFEKGNVMDNEIHLRLSKTNLNESSILEFAKIIDFLDLDLELFILWADPNSTKQKNKRRQISGTTRQNVLMRDNYTCQICGATVEDGAKLEIDHLVPVSKGGTNEEDNLQVLCQQCNREKHNRTDLLHDKKKLAELQGK